MHDSNKTLKKLSVNPNIFMSTENTSELIDFVYEKAVEEDVWDIEIVEQGR